MKYLGAVSFITWESQKKGTKLGREDETPAVSAKHKASASGFHVALLPEQVVSKRPTLLMN